MKIKRFNRSHRRLGSLCAGMVLLCAAPDPARAQAVDESLCSPWTEWIPPRRSTDPLLFSFRICGLPNQRVLVEWRWANTSLESVRFLFQLYSSDPGSCDTKTGRSFASGKRTLRGGQYEEFATGRRRVAQMEFSSRQLWWCMVPEP